MTPQVPQSSKTKTPLLATLNIRQRQDVLRYAINRAQGCHTEVGQFRNLLLWRDKVYQRQLDTTAEQIQAQLSNKSGDARKLQNLAVPIAMPQVETATAYQTAVYLSKYPIFPVFSDVKNEQAALQFQTTIADQAIQWGWPRELIKTFRNGFKYNFAPAFVGWKKRPISNVVTDTSISAAGLAKINESLYGGNCIESIDPYNCFMDMRVSPAQHHEEGEFFGWNRLVNRITLKRFVQRLDPSKTTQLREAFESGYMSTGGNTMNCQDIYYPVVNPWLSVDRLAKTGTNWLEWAGLEQRNSNGKINYKNQYVLTTFIFRALPSDFGASGNQPTIYLAHIVNWKHVIYVEEVISAHDYLPVFILQPNEDGLGYQTQSLLDNAMPFQDMSSALWNISLESKRRLVFDRLVYNPKFVDKKDIDPASSVARIPLRNSSQFKGDNLAHAVFPIPYREDNTTNNIQMSEQISQMADIASGQNKVQRGQFQPGNKSVQEFQQTMEGSNSRSTLQSMTIEHQFMQPVKETIKANTLIFQEKATLLNPKSKEMVEVDPVTLRDSILNFKMTDGQLPIEQIMNPNLMTVFLQTAQAMPVVMSEYDVMGMFIYWLELQGAYWLNDFKRDTGAQQNFLQLYQQTSQAQNAKSPDQQVSSSGLQPGGGTAS
jgi:hypothetical protein